MHNMNIGAATSTAVICEFPFDKAKHGIAGNNLKIAAAATILRIPLGSFLLIVYDHILFSLVEKSIINSRPTKA